MIRSVFPIVLFSCLGCSSSEEGSPSPQPALVVGKPWEAVALEGEPLVEFTSITLSLGYADRLDGSAGLNRYRGTYTIDGSSFSANVHLTTRSDLDRPEGVLEQERRFIELLGRVDGWRLEDASTLLLTRGGTPLLRFRHQRLW